MTQSPAAYSPVLITPVTPTELPVEEESQPIEDSIRQKLRDKSYEQAEELFSTKQRTVGTADDQVPQIDTASIWGLNYHALTMEQTLDYIERLIAIGKPSCVVTANLNYAMLCFENPRLAEFTRKAALVLCDGMPILWRSKVGKTKLPERVAGSDLIYTLAERCAQRGLSIYLYGAADGVAQKAADNLCARFPGLKIAGVQSPPFHASSSTEVQASLLRIKQSQPDVLLVALGQPKGEYWIEDHMAELDIPVSIQLGASFDFVAGNAVRAPRVWQVLGLEWLYRTLRDPKRLAPRYLRNAFFLAKAVRRELIDLLS